MAPPGYPAPSGKLISPAGLQQVCGLFREIRETGMKVNEFVDILFRDYGVRFLDKVPAEEEEALIEQLTLLAKSRKRRFGVRQD